MTVKKDSKVHVTEFAADWVHSVAHRVIRSNSWKLEDVLEGDILAGRGCIHKSTMPFPSSRSDDDEGLLTIQWCDGTTDLKCPLRWILCLPNGPHTIELSVVQVEGRIAWAGKRIVGESSNGKVSGSVKQRLRNATRNNPAICSLFKAVDILAFEDVFNVACLGLGAPLQVDVASERTGVVSQTFGSNDLDFCLVVVDEGVVCWDREGDP